MKCVLTATIWSVIPLCAHAVAASYPLSMNVLPANVPSSTSTAMQDGKAAFCSDGEPNPGFETGFCKIYNPPYMISQESALLVSASVGSKLYTVSCGPCEMPAPGQYPARQSGRYIILHVHRIDKQGNLENKWREIKLRIIRESNIAN